MLSADPQRRSLQDAARLLYRQDGHWQGETWIRRKGGEAVPLLLSGAPVRGQDGTVEHYIVVFSDISEIKAHEQELERLAHHDALTGLANRRLFNDRLAQAVAHAARHGEPLAVCALDLDGFKPVNDRYGHGAGDQVLVEIAQRLRAQVRAEDTVGRMGGDEFTLLLRNPRGPAVFERLLDAVRQPIQLAQGPVQVSASAGIAYLDARQAHQGEQLLRRADQALYQAKATGRDRYSLIDAAVDGDGDGDGRA